jgi:hypothetical protein
MLWLAMVLVLVLIVDLLLLYRYKHPKIECYTKSKKLVDTVSMGLKRHFLPIFQHLYQIRKDEGVATDEGCMESLLQKITIAVSTTTATIFPTAFLSSLEMVSSSTLSIHKFIYVQYFQYFKFYIYRYIYI